MSFMTNGRIDRVINVRNAVTTRKVYLDQQGVDMTAALRRYYEDRIYAKSGEEVQVSFPILVHWVFDEFIKMKEKEGVDVMRLDEDEE